MKPITRDDIARAVHAPSHVDYTVSTYEAAQADRVLALLREHGREGCLYESTTTDGWFIYPSDAGEGWPIKHRRMLVIELEDDQ